MRGSAYLRALETALHGAGLPYGYAITMWSTGAVLIGAHGPPSLGRVYLFAAGAASAYGGLRFLTETTEGEAGTQLTCSPHLIRAGAIHVTAIALAIGAAALIARIDGLLAWPLAPFAATLLYLGVSSVEKALIDREREPSATGGEIRRRRRHGILSQSPTAADVVPPHAGVPETHRSRM